MALKVYIVEDTLRTHHPLVETLEEVVGAYVAGVTSSTQEAITWLGTHLPLWDLAIVDMPLAQDSGLEILKACTNRPENKQVVVFSNSATDEMRARCTQLGADAFFEKPHEIDALLDFCMENSLENQVPVAQTHCAHQLHRT